MSVKALSQLAVMAPSATLPLVVQRFRDALQTATATHQLASAITAMAMCVRPMLLARPGDWTVPPPPGADTGADGEAGAEGAAAAALVAEALLAVLPGIDANDEGKTSAVLHLYASVLSSVPRLRGAGDGDDDGNGPDAAELAAVYGARDEDGAGAVAAGAAPMEVEVRGGWDQGAESGRSGLLARRHRGAWCCRQS